VSHRHQGRCHSSASAENGAKALSALAVSCAAHRLSCCKPGLRRLKCSGFAQRPRRLRPGRGCSPAQPRSLSPKSGREVPEVKCEVVAERLLKSRSDWPTKATEWSPKTRRVAPRTSWPPERLGSGLSTLAASCGRREPRPAPEGMIERGRPLVPQQPGNLRERHSWLLHVLKREASAQLVHNLLIVPIPTKPPVCNGIIAPRDSWMMPPAVTR
jgi:hypothetical protein